MKLIFAVSAGLTGGTLLIVRHTIRNRVRESTRVDVGASVHFTSEFRTAQANGEKHHDFIRPADIAGYSSRRESELFAHLQNKYGKDYVPPSGGTYDHP